MMYLFPAYAGVIPNRNRSIAFQRTFPRIRGGDPNAAKWLDKARRFSPHTRG